MNMKNRGFTLTELTVGIVLTLIVILGIGVVMGNTSQGWQTSYNNANGITAYAFATQHAFDNIIRKATWSVKPATNGAGSTGPGTTLDVYLILDPNTTTVNQRVHFYVSSNTLYAGYYTYPGGSLTATQNLGSNIQSCSFEVNDKSVQMVLNLTQTDSSGNVQSLKAITSSDVHN